MTWSVYLWAALLVLVFSALLSMAGLGAAFLFVPFFYWLGVPLHQSMSMGLFLNFLSLSFASVVYWRNGLVNLRAGLPIAIAAIIFSPLGAVSSQFVERRILLWLFAAFLIFAAYMMLFYRSPRSETKKGGKAEIGVGALVGMLAGYLGGLLGVGGGNIILPALTWAGYDAKVSAGTTALVVVFSSLAGFLGRVSVGGLNYGFLGVVSLAATVGSLSGAWLMKNKLSSSQLKRIIGVALFGMAIKIIVDLWR